MKKLFIYSSLCLVVFAVILALMFPAKTAWSFINDEMPEITIGSIDGSVWSPELKQISYHAKQNNVLSGIQINSVQLDTSVLALFSGNFSTDINLQDELMNATAQVTANSDTATLEAVNFNASIAELVDLVQLPMMNGQNITDIFSADGSIKGQLSAELDIQKGMIVTALEGAGTVEQSTIRLPIYDPARRGFVAVPMTLGTLRYTVDLNDEQWIRITLTDNDGELDLAGTIEIAQDKRYKLNLNTTQQLPAALQQTLGVLGRKEQGRLHYKWSSRLP